MKSLNVYKKVEMNRVEDKKRIEYLDVAKGIAMLCVILAHIPVPDIPAFVNRICFSFHMPVFFLLSGYLFKKTDMNTFIVRKSKQLLLPYLYTSGFVILFSVCINWYSKDYSITTERNILEWLWAGFYGSGNTFSEPFWIKHIGAIWFFLAIFFALLLLNFCLHQKYSILWVIVFVLLGNYTKSVIWLPFSIQAALLSLGYVYIGYEIKRKNLLEKILSKLIIVAGLFCLWLVYIINDGGHLYLVQGYFEKGLILEILFSTAASLCLLWLSRLISMNTKYIKRFFSFYGKNSLLILCIHLVELNTFRWNTLIDVLKEIGLSHGLCILIMYCLKIIWVTVVSYLIAWVKNKWIVKKQSLKNESVIKVCELNEKNKIDQLNLVKGLAVILVILSHLAIGNNLRIIIFSLSEPILFMLIGLMFCTQSRRLDLYKEGRKLLLAYLGFCFIYFIGTLWKDVFYYGGRAITEITNKWVLSTVFGMSFSSTILKSIQSVGYIWIVISLLCTLIIGALVFNIKSEKIRACVVIAVSIFGIYVGKNVAYLPFSLDVAMVCIIFLYSGYLYQFYGIREKIAKAKYLVLLIVLWIIQIKIGGIELAVRNYPYGILSVIGSIAGCILMIEVSYYLARINGINQILGIVGKNYLLFLGIYYLTLLCDWNAIMGEAPIIQQFLVKLILCGALGTFAIIIKDNCYPRLLVAEVWEKVYLTVAALYIIRVFCDTALLSLPWPITFFPVVRIIAIGVVLFKLICLEPCNRKNIFSGIVVAGIFTLSFVATGYEFLFDLAILLIGAVDIPYKKILKVYVWCAIIIMGLAMLGSLTGAVRDLTYVKDKTYRHSFGICYPTDFAAHGIYLLLSIWVLYENIPVIISIIAMLLFAAFQYRYCYTECSEIVAVLSAVGMTYVWLVSRIKDKKSLIAKFTWCIDQLLTVFMGICAGVIIWMSIKCSDEYPLLKQINVLISGRLSLAQSAFNEYGIKYFGTAFDMVGFGSETVRRSGYNFVDSSFCLILVRYGMAVLAAVLVIYFLVERKALRSGKRKLMVAFALISIHSVIEQHLLELAYNPFLLLAFADISPESDGQVQAKKKITRNQIGYCIGAALLFMMMPIIIPYGKTIVTLLRLYEPGRNKYFIAAVLILAVAAAMFIKEAVDLILLRLDKEKICQKKGLMAASSFCVLLLALIVSEHTISRKMFLYEESLETGKKAISALQKADLPPYKIFVDDIPEIYKRQVGGISNRVMTADSAADDVEEDIVLIAKNDRDIFRLTDEGCWFGELSDREGIYTDSEEAVKILEENGISMSDHYSVRKEVDLADLAGRNGLAMSENGGLLVEGQDKSLIYGSYDVIYHGRLRVEYKLKLLDSSITDGELAKVRLSFDWGRNVVKEQGLTRADFDENGYCTAVIEEDVNTSEGGEYLLFANGDTRIEIESISYGKVDME